MPQPTVSVIIPAYNNAAFIGTTIQSVLDQTYPHFEVMVVNDASPDNVDEVIKQFTDPRIRYIIHDKNRGLSAARNTAIRASTGEIIALLDGDDLFHPEKLRMHVEFLEKHPEIDVTYNARFELNHSARTVRELWRPPLTLTLADLLPTYPFSPSDMVIRRDSVFKVNLFDEYHTYVGEDLDFNCRLAMAGCKFASVNRALNYRWYHSGRIVKNLRSCVDDTLRPLKRVFSDPACPPEALAVRDLAYATHYLLWSAIAFGQDDTALGQEYSLAAVRLNPSFLEGTPSRLIEVIIAQSIADESVVHDALLRRMLDQLPAPLAWPAERYDWAVAHGYLLRGVRAIMWGRTADGEEHFERAMALRAQIDEAFLRRLTAQLLDYETEFGFEATQKLLFTLSPYLEKIGNRSGVRWLKGHYLINQAFKSYQVGEYDRVPKKVFNALANDLSYLGNRGVLSILVRSIISK